MKKIKEFFENRRFAVIGVVITIALGFLCYFQSKFNDNPLKEIVGESFDEDFKTLTTLDSVSLYKQIIVHPDSLYLSATEGDNTLLLLKIKDKFDTICKYNTKTFDIKNENINTYKQSIKSIFGKELPTPNKRKVFFEEILKILPSKNQNVEKYILINSASLRKPAFTTYKDRNNENYSAFQNLQKFFLVSIAVVWLLSIFLLQIWSKKSALDKFSKMKTASDDFNEVLKNYDSIFGTKNKFEQEKQKMNDFVDNLKKIIGDRDDVQKFCNEIKIYDEFKNVTNLEDFLEVLNKNKDILKDDWFKQTVLNKISNDNLKREISNIISSETYKSTPNAELNKDFELNKENILNAIQEIINDTFNNKLIKKYIEDISSVIKSNNKKGYEYIRNIVRKCDEIFDTKYDFEIEQQKIKNYIDVLKKIIGNKDDIGLKNLENEITECNSKLISSVTKKLEEQYSALYDKIKKYNSLQDNKNNLAYFKQLIMKHFAINIDLKIADLLEKCKNITNKDNAIIMLLIEIDPNDTLKLKELFEKYKYNYTNLNDKNTQLQEELDKEKTNTSYLNTKVAKLEGQLKSSGSKIDSQSNEIEKLKGENSECKNQLSNTENKLNKISIQINTMQKKEENTINLIDNFIKKYEEIKEIKFMSLKSLFMSIFALNDLLISLLTIWNKQNENVSKDVKENIKSLSEGILLSLETKRLYNTYTGSESIDNFIKLKTDLKEYLDKFNWSIDEDIWDTLIEWFKRGMEYDNLKEIETKYQTQIEDLNRLSLENDKLSKKVKENNIFTDKMYLHFVKEFSLNVRKKDLESDLGQSWFFEHLFNIAYHAIDYIEYSNGTSLKYSYNYSLLQNDLNFDKLKDNVKKFVYNDAFNSDPYSNAIYEYSKKLQIKKLQILIGQFYIDNFDAEVE